MNYFCFYKEKQDSHLKYFDIYVVGFSYPVVPKGLARIRVQISSSHNKKQIDKAVSLFKKAGQEFGVVN